MIRRLMSLALLVAFGCSADDMVSEADIPPDAPPLSRFDGEWFSEDFAYRIEIVGRLGTVTFSNSGRNPVGELILVIQSEEGAEFTGLQVFSDGNVREVLGRLSGPDTLQMSGGGSTWELTRVRLPEGTVVLSPDDIPEDAPPLSLFDGEWLDETTGYAVEIVGRLGTTTFSNSDATPEGELALVILGEDGTQFTGRQLFADGLVREVLGRLVDFDTLRLTGGPGSVDLRRIGNARGEGMLSADDIPDGAPAIDRFDGEWLAEDAGYALEISGRLGTITFTNSDATPIGALALVILSEDGTQFTGRQLYADGVVRDVLGRLVDLDTMRLTGGGDTLDLLRISNAAPVADAGANAPVEVGRVGTLDATESTDADVDDELSFVWTQVLGEEVMLSSTTDAVATFVAPATPQLLGFRVTVTDLAGATDEAEVRVTVTPAIR
ncbi:MAG: hypothetical protein AAGH15_07480 [Myxococcota bacterium]